MDIRTVKIPSAKQHEGFYSVTVRLNWICPVCGNPRGEINHNARSYDGSRVLFCDGWGNPCGHVDYYENVLEEAYTNGLNYHMVETD